MAAEAAAKARPAGMSWTKLVARLRAQMLRRISWGLADQGMSSITNAAVSIYVYRALGPAQFGAFSLALVTYAFGLNASRGLATDPLMVRFSGTDVATWRRAVSRCTGTATVVGLVIGACSLCAAAVLHGTTGAAFCALALAFPGLMLQDSWRFSFFALGKGSRAFVNDLIWAIVLFPSLAVLRTTGHADIFWFVLAWGGAAGVAAAIGPLQSLVIPHLSGAWSWVRDHRDLGPRYVAEGVSSAGANQLRTYGITFLLGLAAVGYVQASSTLMGPFVVIYFAMSLVMIPEASRVLQRSPRRLPKFCLAMGGGLGLAGLAWGTVLLVGLPLGLGTLILGHTHPWQPVYPLVLPQMLATVGQGLSSGAAAGLHALGAARRSLRAMVWTSVSYVVFGLIGAVLNGAVGTLEGLVVSSVVGAALSWWQLRAGLREYRAGAAEATAAAAENAPARQAGRHRTAGEAAGQPAAGAVAAIGTTADAATAAASLPARQTGWQRDEAEEIQLTMPIPRINYP